MIKEGMGKRGFTLIELIVVIAIIAILTAIVAPNAFRAIEKAKISKALGDWGTFKSATMSFYADTGLWPGTSGTFIRIEDTGLITNPGYAGWDGSYLEKLLSVHPWAGTYWLSRNLDYNANGVRDLDLEMGDECRGGGGSNCEIPRDTAIKMDGDLDDGVLTTGDVRYFGDGNPAGGDDDFRRLLVPDSN